MNVEKKQKKSIENEKQSQNAENISQRLLVKRKPLFFVDAISQLNEAHINSVKEIGFESVLHYRIEYIPSRLAFSLLKSFDEEKCNITYCREKWKSNAHFMRELAEQCDTKPGNVNHKAVEQLMLADKEGGPQFKRLFLVLLESALIESSTCGMIKKTKIGEIIDDLDNVRNINWCPYTISVLKFAMGNWSKTEKNAFAVPLPFLMNLLPKNSIQEEQQQGNEEKSVDVNESGVGSSSQIILPSHMVANIVKYIKQINDGRTNLLRVLKEASSQIENNDLFGLNCDIARSAIGSQKSPVASVSDIFLHLSQSYNIDNDVAVGNWKALFDSIRNAEKANETIEDLNGLPTFRLDDCFDKAVEQRNKDNLPTSPVGDPEELRQTVEEDEQRKENMICDDHNESNSPISTAVLGSPRTTSPSLQQQEINASEHDNTLASLIGSKNMGNELEIQEEEDREDAAACSIVEYMMQEGIETMDDTPPEWNVQKQGYKGKETMHEEKEKTPENTERRMTVYQVFFPVFTSGYYYLVVFWMKINKIEIIDSVNPLKAKDPLEKYSLHVGILKDMFEAYFKEKNISELSQNIKKSPYKVKGNGREWNIGFSPRGTKILQILRGRYCEAMLTSRSNKKCMDMVRVADDWMTANKHRLPELQNKFKEWFSCKSKK
ncbi:hypothetical protein SASPL_144782 [Salvia splendens]|uniref:Uncharacterized protein n=1 Tax=Salvia splendens TaxID=180675 RepID=A0A8X8WHU0_SALSN|nr:hypothetical protein SASPL_144782 [Salvia splendens]